MNITIASKWPCLARLSMAIATLAGPLCAQAQLTGTSRYTVVDLGPVGPSSSPGQPLTINHRGMVSGEVVVAKPGNTGKWVSQAVLWERTSTKVIGNPGLGGPNSVAFGVNNWDQAVGQAETQTPDFTLILRSQSGEARSKPRRVEQKRQGSARFPRLAQPSRCRAGLIPITGHCV